MDAVGYLICGATTMGEFANVDIVGSKMSTLNNYKVKLLYNELHYILLIFIVVTIGLQQSEHKMQVIRTYVFKLLKLEHLNRNKTHSFYILNSNFKF